MKRFFISLVTVSLLMLSISGCGGGSDSSGNTNTITPTVLLTEDFSAFTVGSNFTSSSWSSMDGGALPVWQIQEATKALDANSAGDMVYSGVGSSSWTNYTFEYKFKVADLNADITAFVRSISGAESAQSYYQVTLSNGNNLSLCKNPSDAATSVCPASASITYSANNYYPVKIVVNGNNVKIYFTSIITFDIDWTDDGALYGPLQPAGSIGLAVSGIPVYFDDLAVTAL